MGHFRRGPLHKRLRARRRLGRSDNNAPGDHKHHSALGHGPKRVGVRQLGRNDQTEKHFCDKYL